MAAGSVESVASDDALRLQYLGIMKARQRVTTYSVMYKTVREMEGRTVTISCYPKFTVNTTEDIGRILGRNII